MAKVELARVIFATMPLGSDLELSAVYIIAQAAGMAKRGFVEW